MTVINRKAVSYGKVLKVSEVIKILKKSRNKKIYIAASKVIIYIQDDIS